LFDLREAKELMVEFAHELSAYLFGYYISKEYILQALCGAAD